MENISHEDMICQMFIHYSKLHFCLKCELPRSNDVDDSDINKNNMAFKFRLKVTVIKCF